MKSFLKNYGVELGLFGMVGYSIIIGIQCAKMIYDAGYFTGQHLAYEEINKDLTKVINHLDNKANKETVEETTEG